jgi:hypothetical protein
MTCKLITRKPWPNGLFEVKAPRPAQYPSMTTHLDYPQYSRPQAHRNHTCRQNRPTLTGITPVAKLCTQASHLLHTMNQTDKTQTRQIQPNQTQLIMWKVDAAHDREHSYHDSLHNAEVGQLYPQLGDFIASQATRSLHSVQCTPPLVRGQEITT